MTRVLQCMAGAAHGGAEAFFTRLVAALARAGLEQHAVIRGHPERSETLRRAGVPVTETRFGGPLDLYDAARLAVHAHGRAAELWTQSRHASAGLLAVELASFIPEALEQLRAPD